jgi:hypothetical protein
MGYAQQLKSCKTDSTSTLLRLQYWRRTLSKVRVTLNYVDLAHLLVDIKKSDTFEEVVIRTNRLEAVLDEAAKDKNAEYLKG